MTRRDFSAGEIVSGGPCRWNRVSAAAEPLVSIGLPVRNGERYLGEAVRSLLDRDDGRVELVISGNAF
jgi:hypothetical protein